MNGKELAELLEKVAEKAAKQTARDILSRLNEYYLDYNYDLKREFEKLCRDYGVDLEDE